MNFDSNCDTHLFNCKQISCLQLHLIKLVIQWFNLKTKAGIFLIVSILLHSFLTFTKAAPINRSQLNQSTSNIDQAIVSILFFNFTSN